MPSVSQTIPGPPKTDMRTLMPWYLMSLLTRGCTTVESMLKRPLETSRVALYTHWIILIASSHQRALWSPSLMQPLTDATPIPLPNTTRPQRQHLRARIPPKEEIRQQNRSTSGDWWRVLQPRSHGRRRHPTSHQLQHQGRTINPPPPLERTWVLTLTPPMPIVRRLCSLLIRTRSSTPPQLKPGHLQYTPSPNKTYGHPSVYGLEMAQPKSQHTSRVLDPDLT